MINKKTYKDKKSKNNMILPGDPKGLPDDFSNAIIFVDNASKGIYNVVLSGVNLYGEKMNNKIGVLSLKLKGGSFKSLRC